MALLRTSHLLSVTGHLPAPSSPGPAELPPGWADLGGRVTSPGWEGPRGMRAWGGILSRRGLWVMEPQPPEVQRGAEHGLPPWAEFLLTIHGRNLLFYFSLWRRGQSRRAPLPLSGPVPLLPLSRPPHHLWSSPPPLTLGDSRLSARQTKVPQFTVPRLSPALQPQSPHPQVGAATPTPGGEEEQLRSAAGTEKEQFSVRG